MLILQLDLLGFTPELALTWTLRLALALVYILELQGDSLVRNLIVVWFLLLLRVTAWAFSSSFDAEYM